MSSQKKSASATSKLKGPVFGKAPVKPVSVVAPGRKKKPSIQKTAVVEAPSPPVKTPESQTTPVVDTPSENVVPVHDNSLLTIHITKLADVVLEVFQQGLYTPLILDPSGRTDVFFAYSGGDLQAVCLDLKPILVKTQIEKSLTMQEGKEHLRKHLVNSMKYGKVLLLQMTNTAFNFTHFSDPAYFPKDEVLAKAGQALHDDETLVELLVRPEDREPNTNLFIVRPEFKVALTSKFDPEDYAEFLDDALPLDRIKPIAILPPEKK